jgi:hypothetical protein
MELPVSDPALRAVRDLLVAVCQQAFDALAGPLWVEYPPGEPVLVRHDKDALEARWWILSKRHGYPFDYLEICEMLGLDPEAGRRLLAKVWKLRERARRAVLAGKVKVRMKRDSYQGVVSLKGTLAGVLPQSAKGVSQSRVVKVELAEVA